LSKGPSPRTLALERYAWLARQFLCMTRVRPVISDGRVLATMLMVPRHRYMPASAAPFAYEDQPVPIGFNATISQPSLVAQMTEALRVGPQHKVLEIGTGSGYQAAVLGCLAGAVVTVERVPELAWRARRALRLTGCDRVEVVLGDGSLGAPDHAPFDRVMITAAAPTLPEAIQSQVVDGGLVVAPIGPGLVQHVMRYQRRGDRWISEVAIPDVRFVPLLGEQGWASVEAMQRSGGLPACLVPASLEDALETFLDSQAVAV